MSSRVCINKQHWPQCRKSTASRFPSIRCWFIKNSIGVWFLHNSLRNILKMLHQLNKNNTFTKDPQMFTLKTKKKCMVSIHIATSPSHTDHRNCYTVIIASIILLLNYYSINIKECINIIISLNIKSNI